MWYWLRLLGTISGGVSVFNLIRRYFNLRLTDVFRDIVELYQSIFHPLFSVILYPLRWMGFSLPHWLLDVATIYSIIGAAFFRGYLKSETNDIQSGSLVTYYIIVSLMSMLWPLSILGLALRRNHGLLTFTQLRRLVDILPYILRPLIRSWTLSRVIRFVMVVIPMVTELSLIIMVFIIFFVLNFGVGLYKTV